MKYMRACAYNVDVAKIFGVTSSILLSHLENLASICRSCGKFNGNITVTREDICEVTAVTEIELRSAEKVLSDIGVLTVSDVRNSQKVSYTIDEKQLREVLLSGVSIIQISNPNVTEKKTVKRKSKKDYAKSAINYGDEEVDNKLREWLSSLYEAGKGGLSRASIEMQQEDLRKFSQGNNSVALEVLNIAIKRSYRNLEWAIKAYQESKGKSNSYNFSDYEAIRSSGEDRSEEVF